MRSSKSRSRGKNRNNNNRSMGNIVNRVFDSSGPEGKVRGTPQQIIEKYQMLHRDAQLSNDRVAAENFAQHAEHYTRMLGEAMREQDARREAHEAQQREQNASRDDQRDQNRGFDQQGGDHAQGGGDQPQSDQPAQGQRRNTRKPRNPDQRAAKQQPVAQSDVIDFGSSDDDGDTGLVETVESAPKPKPKMPRARKPKSLPTEPDPKDQSAAE